MAYKKRSPLKSTGGDSKKKTVGDTTYKLNKKTGKYEAVKKKAIDRAKSRNAKEYITGKRKFKVSYTSEELNKKSSERAARAEKREAERATKTTPKATGKKNRVSHDPDYRAVSRPNTVDKTGAVSNINANNSLSAQYSNLMHDGSDFSKMTKTKSKKLRASEPIKKGTITNRGIVTSKKRFRNEAGDLVERVTIKNPKHKRRNVVGGSLSAEIQYQQSKNTAGTPMKKTKLKRKKKNK